MEARWRNTKRIAVSLFQIANGYLKTLNTEADAKNRWMDWMKGDIKEKGASDRDTSIILSCSADAKHDKSWQKKKLRHLSKTSS